MTADFREAALRHFQDAVFLGDERRMDNASHLMGVAVECALKHRLEEHLGGQLSSDGRGHLPWIAERQVFRDLEIGAD